MTGFENEKEIALGHITRSSYPEIQAPWPFQTVNMVPNHRDEVDFTSKIVVSEVREVFQVVLAAPYGKFQLK